MDSTSTGLQLLQCDIISRVEVREGRNRASHRAAICLPLANTNSKPILKAIGVIVQRSIMSDAHIGILFERIYRAGVHVMSMNLIAPVHFSFESSSEESRIGSDLISNGDQVGSGFVHMAKITDLAGFGGFGGQPVNWPPPRSYKQQFQ